MKTKTFEFTLVLKNVNETMPHLKDSLYDAGCDDALVQCRNGAIYLDFDRDGHRACNKIFQYDTCIVFITEPNKSSLIL